MKFFNRIKDRLTRTYSLFKAKSNFQYLIPVILFAFIIVFRQPLENLLDFLVVMPILRFVKPSIPADIVLLICFLASIIIIFTKFREVILSKRKPNFYLIYCYVFIICIYLLERFSANYQYESFTFTFISQFYYLDIFFLGIIPFFIKSEPIQKELSAKLSSIYEDDESTFGKDDLFKRSTLINRITENTLNMNTTRAYAISIQGEWGTGKSYILNRIKDRIKENSEDNIVIEFNPWKFENPNDIYSAFFNLLIQSIKPYNKKLSNDILKYFKSIKTIDDNTLTRSLFELVNLISPQLAIHQLYDDIKNTIPSIGKRFHVFIDDLDRLDKEEVAVVLKLIRNTANFPNFIYYVAFDKEYLNGIVLNGSTKSDQFLEKIFQLQVTLPQINSSVLFQKLCDLLDNNKSSSNKDSLYYRIFSLRTLPLISDSHPDEISKDVFKPLFKNLRDIVRFVNLINIEYPLVKDRVDDLEFILLEIVKFKYPNIYKLLRNEYLLEYKSINGNLLYSINLENDEIKAIQDHESQIALKNILEYLFISDRETPITLSVRYVRNHMQFFAYDSYDNITHDEFINIKSQSSTENRTKMIQLLSTINENDFCSILLAYNSFYSKDDYEQIIELLRVTYYVVKTDSYRNKISTHLFELLRFTQPNIKALYNDDNVIFETFLTGFLQNSHYPALLESSLSSQFLNLILNNDISYIPLKEIDYKNFIFSYFENHLKEPFLSDITIALFRNNFHSIDSFTSKIRMVPEACQVLRNQVLKSTKNKVFFAKQLIVPFTKGAIGGDSYTLDMLLFQVFQDRKDFENFLDSLPEDLVSLELKTFYYQFLDSKMQPIYFKKNSIEIISDEKTKFLQSSTFPQLKQSKAVKWDNGNPEYKTAIESTDKIFYNYKWISHCYPEQITDEEATNGGVYEFKRKFHLPSNCKVLKASIHFAVDDYCEIYLNGTNLTKNSNIVQNGPGAIHTIPISTELFKNGNDENELFIKITNKSAEKLRGKPIHLTHAENIYGIVYALRMQLQID